VRRLDAVNETAAVTIYVCSTAAADARSGLGPIRRAAIAEVRCPVRVRIHVVSAAGTAVTLVAVTVCIAVSLIRVGGGGAVVAGRTDTIGVGVRLIGVRTLRTVVTDVTHAVVISIRLVGIATRRTVVQITAHAVAIGIALAEEIAMLEVSSHRGWGNVDRYGLARSKYLQQAWI
jgi:hypothetical protein